MCLVNIWLLRGVRRGSEERVRSAGRKVRSAERQKRSAGCAKNGKRSVRSVDLLAKQGASERRRGLGAVGALYGRFNERIN